MAKVTQKGREKALQQITRQMQRVSLPAAQRLVPVDTGELQRSLDVKQVEGAAYLFSDKGYAPNVEFGTEEMSPQPFLRPAVRRLNNSV